MPNHGPPSYHVIRAAHHERECCPIGQAIQSGVLSSTASSDGDHVHHQLGAGPEGTRKLHQEVAQMPVAPASVTLPSLFQPTFLGWLGIPNDQLTVEEGPRLFCTACRCHLRAERGTAEDHRGEGLPEGRALSSLPAYLHRNLPWICIFLLCPHASATITSQGLTEYLTYCYGIPHDIASHQGTHFAENEVRQWAQAPGIHSYYIPQHPEAAREEGSALVKT